MIEIHIRKNSIKINGHANSAPKGHDIVCAAVSALTFTLIASLQDLSADMIESQADNPGHIVVSWQKLSDKGRLLIDAWFLGVSMIKRSYGHIEFY